MASEQGGTGPCNPSGLVSSHKNPQQFIFLILGLNFPFVHCHCATLQVILPPLGNQERLPLGACIPQIPAVAAGCREALLLEQPLRRVCSLVRPLGCRRELAGFIHLRSLAPVMDCVVTSSAASGLGMGQGQHELPQ